MFPRVAGPRRLAQSTIALVFWTTVVFIFLPYDSPILSAIRLNKAKALGILRSPNNDLRLLLDEPGQFLLADDEVAYIFKTGYGTKERVLALLEAVARSGPDSGHEGDNTLVVADFTGEIDFRGRSVVIHDMVAAAMSHEAVTRTPTKNMERVYKYGNMTQAIQQGHSKAAQDYSRAVGCELDALKFIPSLELAWKSLPNRKWYIMQDDDTFIIRPSLYRLLQHLDPSGEFYLGNAIGDYKSRFAHGGSSLILSRGTMSRLLDSRPDVVSEAYVLSLDETWGDKLVATTLMRIGVYISERYGHLFNGERPLITKAAADRFCSPLVSFHGLAQPAQMQDVAKTFSQLDKPVLWKDLWAIYGQPSLDFLERNPIRLGQDHVGAQDDPSMIRRVDTVEECAAACGAQSKACLAWTWDQQTKLCVMSAWMIVGEQPQGRYSGLHVEEVKSLEAKCGDY